MDEPVSRVAVSGANEAFTSQVRAALEATGSTVVDPANADVITAVGEDAIGEAVVDAARARSPDPAPIVPIAGEESEVGIDHTALTTNAHGLSGTGLRRVEHPVLAVSGASTHRAALDVALVTDEPARISEYAIDRPDGCASIRADGVVVATPLGSDGYAAAVGGPRLAPGAGVAVVPIAPFSTQKRVWVATTRVTVSLERDVESVSLIVDGARTEAVTPATPIEITVDERVPLLVPAAAGDDTKRSKTF